MGGIKSITSRTGDSPAITLPGAAPIHFDFHKSPNAHYGAGGKDRYSVEMTLSGDKSKVFAALARMPKVSIEGMTHHMPDTATGRKHAAMQLGTWLDDLASPHCDRADVREAVKAMPSRSRA